MKFFSCIFSSLSHLIVNLLKLNSFSASYHLDINYVNHLQILQENRKHLMTQLFWGRFLFCRGECRFSDFFGFCEIIILGAGYLLYIVTHLMTQLLNFGWIWVFYQFAFDLEQFYNYWKLISQVFLLTWSLSRLIQRQHHHQQQQKKH